MPLRLMSPSFQNGGMIPSRHTCDGDDVSPALRWSHAPRATQSLVLIVYDPDAPDPKRPTMTWVHWVLYNMPSSTTSLVEGIEAKDLPPGTLQGLNDWHRTGYGGPCPPIGRHRYFFKMLALDAVIRDLKSPEKFVLEEAIQGHVLAQAELIGLYQKRSWLSPFI